MKVRNITTKAILLAAVSSALMLALIKFLRIDIRTITQVHGPYFLAAVLITLTFPYLSSLRWFYLLRGMNIDVPFKKIYQTVAGTWLLGILPGRLGDFSRSLLLPKENRIAGVGSIIFEKIIDIFVLLLYCLTGALILHKIAGVFILLLASVGFLSFIIFRSFEKFAEKHMPEALDSKLKPGFIALDELRSHPSAIVQASLASGFNWLTSILQVYFLFRAVGVGMPLTVILFYLPLTIFVSLIPITLGGVGTRDTAMVSFFSFMAASSQTLAVSVWYFILGFLVPALMGLPQIREISKKIFTQQAEE